MTYNASDFMGGGGRSAKFNSIGDMAVGEIIRIDSRQRTELGSNVLLTWPDGNPKMQFVITLDTGAEPEDEEDDGLRNVYVPKPSQMLSEIARAIRAAGGREPEVGGKLAIKFTTEKPSATKGYNAQKIYKASYKLPERPAVDADSFMDGSPVPDDDEAMPF